MKIILSIIIILLLNTLAAQTNIGLTFGGSKDDIGATICITPDGGYLLAGSTRSYGAGSEDFYLIKLNASWQRLWSATFGGVHQDHVRSVISTDEGIMVLGDVWDGGNGRLGMYLSLVDIDGYEVWNKQYGTSMDDWGHCIIETHGGDFMLLGYSRGFEISGDIYLVRTDHLGNIIWENNYGYNRDDYAMDIIENDDGSFVIIGTKNGFFNDVHANYSNHDADILLVKIDANGDEIWKKTIGSDGHDFGYSIKKATDYGYYVFGSTQSYGAGSFDMFLAKLDEDGIEEWHRTYGGELYEYGLSMDINENGNLFLFGTTRSYGQNNSEDFYLVKVDEDGNNIWELTIGGEFADFGYSVIALPDSGCIVIGSSKSFGSGENDILFVKVDKYGQIEIIIDGIDSTYKNQIVIAPNPVHNIGRVILYGNHPSVNSTMEITSINGKMVKQYILTNNNLSFDVSALPSGVYMYKIVSNNSTSANFTGKLVVY
ncbi:MAG: T9SS type A sorting domain-containing protein [Candidatus Marithrix sp.]